MPDLLVATGNSGKLAELTRLLAATPWRPLAQRDRGVEAIAENGATFLDNALLKARHAAAIGGCAALADDSGLEVDALHGAPGVRSALYAGEQASDADNVTKLLAALRGVPASARGARFRCVIVLVRDARDPAPIVCEGCWQGTIADAPRGSNGFGYDPVFVPAGEQRTAAQLSAAEKDRASHRGQALRCLLPALAAALHVSG